MSSMGATGVGAAAGGASGVEWTGVLAVVAGASLEGKAHIADKVATSPMTKLANKAGRMNLRQGRCLWGAKGTVFVCI